jgi:hypothetical protein
MRVPFVQVIIDHPGVVENQVAIHESRRLVIGIELSQVGRRGVVH